jgi:hypothetical protein
MTERMWLTARSVLPLRDWYRDRRRDRRRGNLRKERLFACACCRRLWDHMPDARSRAAIDAAEQYADGAIDKSGLRLAQTGATRAARDAPDRGRKSGLGWTPEDAAQLLTNLEWSDVFVATTARALYATANLRLRTVKQEAAEQARLLRDVFGNPFHPIAFSPAWRTGTAVALARTMYAARDFSAMPILADALQDAGCGDEPVLGHCRDPASMHVRGCWVVDLVLGQG